MYNERKENFSVRDIILQVLFVALFIFILLWLFPTKNYMNKAIEPLKDKQEVEVYVNTFNDNINSMSNAAKSYFTTPRLPQEVGDKKIITLGDMLKKKLLLPFVDSEGRQCDLDDSYAEVTKMDDEYTMKINLKCSNNEDYIVVHMGCYDYCEKDICEKDETQQTSNDKKPKPTPTKTRYLYEYFRVVGDSYSDWGNWSSWTTNKVSETKLRDVKTKTDTSYIDENRLVGYKTTTYREPVYENVQVLITTDTEKTCKRYETVYEGTGEYKYTSWELQGPKVVYGATPSNSLTTKYEYIEGSSGEYDCGSCSSNTYASYNVYTRSKVEIKVGEEQCAEYDIKETPVYGTEERLVGYEYKTKKEPYYATVKVEKENTYYSYRTRKLIDGTKVTKWSYYNNKNLLNSGYEYTGKKVIDK